MDPFFVEDSLSSTYDEPAFQFSPDGPTAVTLARFYELTHSTTILRDTPCLLHEELFFVLG